MGGRRGGVVPIGGPEVALVGRPNVGKSSLFNRLVGGRPALVDDMPGVTRDRRFGVCEWNGARFRVVDTGGLDPSAEGILGAMRGQTLRAVADAAVLVLVLDAGTGVTSTDEDVARTLRKSGKPVVVAMNKVDSKLRESVAGEAFSLGFGDVVSVSATHGRGVADLCDALQRLLSEGADGTVDAGGEVAMAQAAIRIAFVGKPNVGKSSLVNRLLGEDRVLVHDQPGTTRDPIDTPFRVGDRDFVLVDTAGLRRRRVVDTLTEAVAAKMARDQIARADVVALVIDARQGATAEDAKLASLIEEAGRGAILVLNKSDLVPRAQIDKRIEQVREELGFISYWPLLLTSAVTGRGVLEIPEKSATAFSSWSQRISTSDLNENFDKIVSARPPPAGSGGKHIKLYFVTQPMIRPPTFFVSVNYPESVGQPYRRYLANQLRATYGFVGSPLRLVLRAHRRKKRGAPGESDAPRPRPPRERR